MRVLVVEDEPCWPSDRRGAARARRWRSTSPTTAPRRWSGSSVNDYDVVVLDRDLPRVHGDEVCRRLVGRRRAARILMLTAAGERRATGSTGLALGADDYLAKPFAFAELVARVRALGRRGRPAAAAGAASAPACAWTPPAARSPATARYVPLTRKEFAVLEMLLRGRRRRGQRRAAAGDGPGTRTPTRSPTSCG